MNKFRRLLATVAAVGMLLSAIPMASAGYFKDVSDDNVFAPYIAHGVGEGYFSTSNEYFYPNNNLTRAELAKIAVMGADLELEAYEEHDFADVKSDNPFYMYVETLLTNNMISANEYYNPNSSVTRAEATKILVNAFGYDLDTTGGPSFSDVSADNVFYAYIETAANNGLVGGYEDGTFKPNNNITRAEAGKLLAVATGYAGEWGEAAGLVLTLSEEETTPGGSLTFTVKVVDEDQVVVQDYDGMAEFKVSTGKLAASEVEFTNGVAKASYTAPGYGAEGTVTVTTDDFMAEGTFSVVIPEDQRMMLYSVDGNINTNDATILYLTVADEEGRPVTGLSNDLTFDVTEGDATLGDVAQFPGGAQGIYRVILTTAGASTGTNVVEATNQKTGDTATVNVEVSQPNVDVYLLDQAVSINQTTTVLVYLTQGDGSPITGATGNLTESFLNSNLGTAAADVEIGDGWYYSVLTADDETADDAKVKVSYTGVTPNVHEYVSLEIAPYNVNMEVIGSDVNNLNGTATVVLTLTDVNGNPIDTDTTINATTDIDFDVITAAYYASPTGDNDWEDANDWFYSFAGVNGVLATQITACGVNSDLCTIEDTDIEVKARVKTATNEVVEVEDSISFTAPVIDEAYAYVLEAGVADAGVVAADDTAVVVAKVLDERGAAVTGLSTDASGASFFNFQLSGGGSTDLAAARVTEIGGGLYVLDTQVAIGANLIDAEFVLELGNTDVHDVTLGLETGAAEDVVYGDTSVAEGVAGAQNRSGVVYVNIDANDELADGGAPTVTEESPIDVDTAGGDDSAVTGVYAYNITADQADEVETATVSVDGVNVTFSVRPIKVRFHSVDTNGEATEVIYGYVTTIDNDGRLISFDADGGDDANEITVDTDGSVNDAEVNEANGNILMTEDPAGNNLEGLAGARFNRGATNDDSYEACEVEYQLNGDDESLYVAKWMFDLVNPTYEVYAQNTHTYVAPTSNVGGTYAAQNAVAIVAVAREDQGVASDLALGNLTAEVTSGDGLVDQDLAAGGRSDTQNFLAVAPAGLYTINYLPEDDPEMESVLNIYPSWDDNDENTVVEFSVEYPEAQVVIFPTKIDPDQTNNEATVLTIVRDTFGNSVNGLVVAASQDLSAEIEGDQQLTDSYVSGTNTIYYGKYTTDEVGIQEVIVKYNDDETIYEGSIVVEMFEN